jgi:hypothetical protein
MEVGLAMASRALLILVSCGTGTRLCRLKKATEKINWLDLRLQKQKSIVSKNGNECSIIHMQGGYEYEMYYGLSPMLTRLVKLVHLPKPWRADKFPSAAPPRISTTHSVSLHAKTDRDLLLDSAWHRNP